MLQKYNKFVYIIIVYQLFHTSIRQQRCRSRAFYYISINRATGTLYY